MRPRCIPATSDSSAVLVNSGLAHRAHRRVRCRRRGDLGADPRRISGGDGDDRLHLVHDPQPCSDPPAAHPPEAQLPHPVGLPQPPSPAQPPCLTPFAVGDFVAQAALQPTAHPRQLRRIQAEVLLLGHLDRHRLERLQPGRAAQRTAAGAVAAEHPRFVAHADLAHLDPRAEMRGEIAHQLAEIDPAFSRVVEDQPRAVEQLLDAGQLHRQAALLDLQKADALRFMLALLVLEPRNDVLLRRAPDDLRRVVGRRPPRRQRGNRTLDGAECRTGGCLDHHLIARHVRRL